MKLRATVVAPDYGDPRCEIGLLARRIAGALAGVARVELLFADVLGREGRITGCIDAWWFPATGPSSRAAEELAALLDPDAEQGEMPRVLREEIHRAHGPDAPALYRRLEAEPPDVLVAVDATAACSYFAIRAVEGQSRTLIVPLAVPSELDDGLVAATLAAADHVATLTEEESRQIAAAEGMARWRAPSVIGFFHRLHPLAAATEPLGFDASRPYCALAAKREVADSRVLPPARRKEILEHARGAPRVVVLGKRTDERVAPPVALPAYLAMNDWRWIHHAELLVDGSIGGGVGLLPLEAMLAGTPVIVHESSAARPHVEAADAGVWFRSAPELAAAVDLLLEDRALAAELGDHGRRYAQDLLGDPDRFTLAVARAALG